MNPRFAAHRQSMPLAQKPKPSIRRRCRAMMVGPLVTVLSLGALLSGCASDDDGDSWSVSAPVAAGQAIRLDTVPTHEAASVYRLTYRSTDARNAQQLVRVSAQVLVPHGHAPAGGWPVLAWAHGESGLHLTCAPSVMGIGTVQARFYDGWLRQGFAIVATDYPGLGEPGAPLLLNARSEGMSVLDAVRAARERLPDLSATVLLNGHAQGAQAALAAASLAHSYAPHLHILGTIAAAPPYLDEEAVHDLLHPANPRSFSPAVPELLTLGESLAEADPTANAPEAFTERGQHAMHDAATMCASDFPDRPPFRPDTRDPPSPRCRSHPRSRLRLGEISRFLTTRPRPDRVWHTGPTHRNRRAETPRRTALRRRNCCHTPHARRKS